MPKCNFLKKFRKTKAQTPSSSPLSSNLVHQQPLRAPALNLNPDGPTMPEAKPPSILATSATQQPLRGPTPNALLLSSEITPTSSSTAKDTALNTLKLVMQIMADAPMPGIKVAMSGLLTIIGKVQETSGNTQGFLNLATWMENLQPIFSKMKDMEVEGTTADIFKELEVKINSLTAEMEWARSNGTLAKFFNSTDDASSLKSHNDHLNQIIHGANWPLTILVMMIKLAITVDIHHEVQEGFKVG
ncbi:hypothetical protein L208DRAFT_1412805 [Tricholoma matsutake]|nr:hypothetical protein L208DRAFT_1412805 [Tricholoma matsutake 945]